MPNNIPESEVRKSQEEWISKLQKLSPHKDILVTEAKNFHEKWHPLKDCHEKNHEGVITGRSILRNEIVLECDEGWEIAKEVDKKLLSTFKHSSIPYIPAFSGNKSIHNHIFFDASQVHVNRSLEKDIETYKIDVALITRLALTNYLLKEADIGSDNIDWANINWSSHTKGHLIREIGCPRDNGAFKTIIDTTPEVKPQPGELELRFPAKVELWKIPINLYSEIIENLKQAIETEKQFGSYTGKEHDEVKGGNIIDVLKQYNPEVQLTQYSENSYYTSHPVHGSTTGRNFSINVANNAWHCFRDNTGGGIFQLIAVLGGIIQCDESVKGGLRGEKFKETIRIAKEKYGIEIVKNDRKHAEETQVKALWKTYINQVNDTQTFSPQPTPLSELFSAENALSFNILKREQPELAAELIKNPENAIRLGNEVLGELSHVGTAYIRFSTHDEEGKRFDGIAAKFEGTASVGSKDGVGEKEESNKNLSLTDKIIQLTLENCELICDQYNDGYAVVNSGVNKTVIKLHSRDFKFYIGKLYYDEEKKGLSKDVFASALITLEGKALYDGEKRLLYNRIASHNGKIYYDMADREGRIIEIDSNGWQFTTDSPVLFRREQHQKAQTEPIRGGNISKLLKYIKLDRNSDKNVLLPTIITTFIPTIDHVLIDLWGDHGSGKSFASESIKELIDPSSTKTRAMPKKDEDLILTLYHNWFTAFDNISDVLKQWQSDILARASTGAGVSKRMLYTDDSEIIYNFKRCILLNGLIIPLTQPDIMDRTILFKFKRIGTPASKERLEKTFEKEKAEIFDGLLDLLSKTLKLKEEDNIEIPPGLRMYDFAQWGEAASRAMGNEENMFLTLYLNKKVDDNYEVIQSSKIGNVLWVLVAEKTYTVLDKERDDNKEIRPFLDENDKWKGSPTELLRIFNWKAQELNFDRRSDWVDSPESLSKGLGKLKTNFRAIGISIEIGREHEGRFINIFKYADDESLLGREKTDTTDTPVTEEQNDSDGCDGCDAKKPTQWGEGEEKTRKFANIRGDLDEDCNIKETEEPTEKEIEDLEEIFQEQYESRDVGKCKRCGKERSLFEYKSEKICALCLQEAIKAGLGNNVESGETEDSNGKDVTEAKPNKEEIITPEITNHAIIAVLSEHKNEYFDAKEITRKLNIEGEKAIEKTRKLSQRLYEKKEIERRKEGGIFKYAVITTEPSNYPNRNEEPSNYPRDSEIETDVAINEEELLNGDDPEFGGDFQ